MVIETNNMNKILLILGSRTFWTVAILVLINSVKANENLISPETLQGINAILGILAVYFKVNPSQDYIKK